MMLGDGLLDVDHPSFRDPVYRERRIMIGKLAMQYKMHEPIPYLKYESFEHDTWKYCYNKLRGLFATHACKEFNQSIEEFERELDYKPTEVP
jgi:phenylalanine-4-hydroxylase